MVATVYMENHLRLHREPLMCNHLCVHREQLMVHTEPLTST